ncbi:hypothetical protein BDV95DRAFT_578851 [Massariosphaeria phaeospora]|uniref:Uncharacterized protein n=1 Tax=Massariosphaeria phaeospora TaxID=100035 RepID=A0A7C8M6A7_9PLEO|nr:hypothetical protein BDV95DRAFT_578851 [Massariosphaeria phaeospora]
MHLIGRTAPPADAFPPLFAEGSRAFTCNASTATVFFVPRREVRVPCFHACMPCHLISRALMQGSAAQLAHRLRPGLRHLHVHGLPHVSRKYTRENTQAEIGNYGHGVCIPGGTSAYTVSALLRTRGSKVAQTKTRFVGWCSMTFVAVPSTAVEVVPAPWLEKRTPTCGVGSTTRACGCSAIHSISYR